VWVNGKVSLVGRVSFVLPEGHETERPWTLKTNSSNEAVQIDLVFTPHGARQEDINLLIIASRFVQPFGVFSGRITVDGTVYKIENAYGVVENHYAKW